MTAADIRAAGGCLCGAVRYEVRGDLRPVVNCHCDQCRRTSGHFVAATAAARDDLQMVADDGLAWYRSSEIARRGFCRVCGSSLFWDQDDAPTVSIMAGSLDQPTGLRTESELFTENRGDYYLAGAPGAPGATGAAGGHVEPEAGR